MAKQVFKGTIYYASKKARSDRLYKEGQSATIESYHKANHLSANFVQIDLDSSGQSYVHMTLS